MGIFDYFTLMGAALTIAICVCFGTLLTLDAVVSILLPCLDRIASGHSKLREPCISTGKKLHDLVFKLERILNKALFCLIPVFLH